MGNATEAQLLLGVDSSGAQWTLPAKYLNRHGLITGATGTGKTRTLQRIVEESLALGISVIIPDVKGDLLGLGRQGERTAAVEERLTSMSSVPWVAKSLPITCWQYDGASSAVPLRTTPSDLGPQLLARLVRANDTQTSVLQLLWDLADNEKLYLYDRNDVLTLIDWATEHRESLAPQWGAVAPNTLATLRRKVAVALSGIELGHPNPTATTFTSQPLVHYIDATRALNDPSAYSTTMTWLMVELFNDLPEVGDLERPEVMLCIDEAHLLFADMPGDFLTTFTQIVRLIRSRGVSVFFISQNVNDVPHSILTQLSHRIHHGARATTTADQRNIRALADGLPVDKSLDVFAAITTLPIGSALCTTLSAAGEQQPAAVVRVAPPTTSMQSVTAQERDEMFARSPLRAQFASLVDQVSAHELIADRRANNNKGESQDSREDKPSFFTEALQQLTKSLVRTAASTISREIVRGIFGMRRR